MTYDFFNAGRLAFGKKITSVFNSLSKLLGGAQERVDMISAGVDYYKQFDKRNYLCPVPTRKEMPARTNEIFELFNGYTYVNNISVDGDNTTFNITIFTPSSSRLTVASGTTTIKNGYAFVKPSVSLDNFNREIRFSTSFNQKEGELYICNFIVENGDVLIVNPNSSDLGLRLGEPANYRYLSIDYIGSGSYTSSRRAECILITRSQPDNRNYKIDYQLNGTQIMNVGSIRSNLYMILYLRSGDTISGETVGSIYRITYHK